MEWLAAKDWNGGQSTPECFEYVQRKREREKEVYGMTSRDVEKRKAQVAEERKDSQEKAKGNGRDILRCEVGATGLFPVQ